MVDAFRNFPVVRTVSDGLKVRAGSGTEVIPRWQEILFFFDWGDNRTIDHVGIVESVSGGTVNTIEGNRKSVIV